MGGEHEGHGDAGLQAILGRFLEDVDDLMTVVDREGRFVYVNATARRVYGVEPQACIGRLAWEFCHPSDLERTQQAFAEWVAGPSSSSYTFWNRQVAVDGTTRHMHWRIHPHGDVDGRPAFMASIARDITALKETERERLQSETRLKQLFAGMLDAVVTIDGRGIIQDASDSVRDVFGYESAELIGQNVKLLMPEPHRSEHDGYLERYRRTGETWILNSTRQFQVLRKDGAQIEIELSVSRIDVPGESEPLFCGSFRDVTARHRAERALADSERRFRAIFDQEYQYIGLLEPDGTLLEMNRTALERTGTARNDVLGRPLWDTGWWSHDPQARERLRQAVRRSAQGEFVRFETEIRCADDERRTVDFSLKPLRDVDGRIALLIPEGRDITELKRTQEREHAMLRSLAALGESASLLAHEIKNPITAVNLALRAVADQLGEDHKVVLEDLVERMKMLEQRIRHALSFARPVGARPEPTCARELARSAIDLLAPEAAARGITLELEVADDVGPLVADRALTEEVLTNLLRNALDALDADGRVRITVRRSDASVELRVDDSGPGIAPGIRDDLFKPFFTTKPEGTGLGLALARKMIQEQHGTLELVDEKERLNQGDPLGGASFRIRLPRSNNPLVTPARRRLR